MALTIGELEALTQDYWDKGGPFDQYFKGNVLMYRVLKNGEKIDGGLKIRETIQYGQPVGGAFNAQSTFDTTKREEHTAAKFDWAYYYEPITYDIDDQVKNAGAAAQIKLIDSKMSAVQKKIRQSMAVDLYANTTQGATGRGILGLPAMISQSSTYGGIAVADLAEWIAGAVTTTTEPLTFAVLRTLKTNCQVGDEVKDRPTVYITTRTLLDVIEGQTVPSQKYEDANLADVGFENLRVNGIPCVSDYLCTSGYVFALNENLMDFKSHKDFFFHREPWKQPTDKPIYTTQIIWAGQMTCKRRSAHGYHSNLS